MKKLPNKVLLWCGYCPFVLHISKVYMVMKLSTSYKMSNKRKSDTNCSWTTKMDDALILSYHHAHIAGKRANGQFTQEAFVSIVKDLQEKFPDKLLDKAKIRNRMKNIKKNWVRCYDIEGLVVLVGILFCNTGQLNLRELFIRNYYVFIPFRLNCR